MKENEARSGTARVNSSTPYESAVAPKVPDHQLLRSIGRGSYGEVWLARNIMGTFRAIKVVYRQGFDDDRPFDREFNGIKNFEPISRSHEGFVDILQVGRNEQAGYFYAVMELADPRDGSSEINPDTYEPKTISAVVATRQALPYEECLEFGLAVSSALSFLHKRGLVHRDIKPSNLIIVNGQLKLADVGMVTEAHSASIAGGTLGYMAPEGAPSPQADVYSLGKVLYELSTGRDRLQHPALPDFWSQAPNLQQLTELNEIVLKACEKDVARRYASAEELHRELVLLQAGESVKRLRLLERLAAFVRKAALILFGVSLLAGYEFFRVYQQRERESKRVADVHAAAGAGLAAKGDFLGALPWYAEALKLDGERPQRAMRHRMNLETAIRYSPRIVRMFFETNDVYDVAFSPNGRELAEALGDGRVLVREIQTGDSYELLGHSNKVQSVSWSSDGNHLLSASADGTARVWSTRTNHRSIILNHSGAVVSAAFNSQNDLVVTASKIEKRGLLRVWRWDRPRVVSERIVHENPPLTVAFSPDDRWIVSGGEDAFAQVLESPSLISTNSVRFPSKAGLPSWVYGAEISPDGKYLATACFDQLARIWDLATFQQQAYFSHDAPVRSVQFSPDQQFLLTACDDYTARIWELNRQVEAFPPLQHNSFVLKATFSPDSRLVATATIGGIVTVWDLAPVEWKSAGLAIYSPDGSYFARIEAGSVQVFNVETEAPAAQPIQAPGKVRDLKFAPDGKRLLVISEDRNAPPDAPLVAQLYSVEGARLGTQFTLTDFMPESVGHLIAGMSGNADRVAVVLGPVVQLWDTEQGRILGGPIHHLDDANAAMSVDGSRLVTYASNQVFLTSGSTGERIKTLEHLDQVDHAAFSPDNLLLATACRDDAEKPRAAYIWDAHNGTRLGSKLQHGDGVSHVAFSVNSEFLLTAGEDRVVKQWRVPSGELVRTFRYERPFVSASFNHDNSRVVTVAGDDTIRVWAAEPGETAGIPLTPPLKHLYNLWDARFIGGGDRILGKRLQLDRWTRRIEAGTNWSRYLGPRIPHDWEKSIWRLNVETKDMDHLRAMAELLSAHQIELDHAAPLPTDELKKRWLNLTRTGLPPFDSDETRAWHQQQTERALQREDAFAALFHLKGLIPLTKSDTHLREQIDRLRAMTKAASEPVVASKPVN